MVFCTLVLIQGPLWRGRFGVSGDLDARLTTTLVLWLIYASYLLLRKFAEGPQMQTLAAVVAIFGYVDVRLFTSPRAGGGRSILPVIAEMPTPDSILRCGPPCGGTWLHGLPGAS